MHRLPAAHSVNFNGDTSWVTTFGTDGVRANISVSDQFGLDQFGGPMSYAAVDTNDYTVYQQGSPTNKVRYTPGANGDISRIDVLDNLVGMLFYATAGQPAAALDLRSCLGRPGSYIARVTNGHEAKTKAVSAAR